MSPFTIFVLLFVGYCDSISIEKVSDKVTKDAFASGDFYPDWVPFKNKHGDELGEFKPVPKRKPKKRLALPANYVLRAIAAPSGDDYYDKIQAETDNDDYYEKKEWSDLNRNAKPIDPDKVINVTSVDTSDIDGIVNIITNSKPSPIVNSILSRTQIIKNDTTKTEIEERNKEEEKDVEEEKNDEEEKNVKEERNDEEEKNVKEEINDEEEKNVKEEINDEEEKNVKEETTEDKDEDTPKENIKTEKPEKESTEDDEKEEDEETPNSKKENQEPKENKQSEEEVEEETEDKKKEAQQLSEQERRENEEKKARILSSVDELKERHAQEQRRISERVREEELLNEERERDGGRKSKYSKETYFERPKWKKISDYDEDDEDVSSAEDKYKINFEKSTTSTKPTRRHQKRKKNKKVATGKISVFKNPQLYIAYDDDNDGSGEATTSYPETTTNSRISEKFSSRYSATAPEEEDNVRISLVPDDDSKSDEPTLFYPKKRKSKHKFKTTTEPSDSSIAESTPDDKKTDAVFATALGVDLTAPDNTETTEADSAPTAVDFTSSASNTAPSASDSAPSAPDSAPSAPGTAPSAPDAVKSASDSHQASTKKEKKKNDNYEFEKGVKRDHHAEHEEDHEEHGKKAYEGVHKETKKNKGHHDKEDHLGKYDDHGGVDKHHHDESGHYGDHHHEEHGKKHAKYEESGKHSKGHSTKGSHDIHKKEEYEKKVEFFEEEGDSAEEENHGGHHDEKAHEKGGKFKKGNLDSSYKGHEKGESGHFAEGGHGHAHKGHRAAAGHNHHAKRGHAHLNSEGQGAAKKWVYHHGFPAKNANLVVIDRRGDQYFHGPRYYG